MSWRAIHDTVAESESLAGLSDFAERLFWRMVATGDAWGRLPGSPQKIRARCIPLLDRPADEVAAALEEMGGAGRILLYEAAGQPYVQIVDFERYQPRDVLGRDGKRYGSRFPDPPETPLDAAETPASEGAAETPARSCAELRGVTPAEIESEIEVGSNRSQPRNGSLIPTSSPKSATAEAVQGIYDFWRAERGKASPRYDRLSDKRREKITTRLKEFTPEELLQAIRGVALDPWPERDRHDDITVIFRSREQVERFIEFDENPPRQQQRTAQALRYGRGMTTEQILRETGNGL